MRREERGVLGGRTHGELIHVCLAKHYHACRIESFHHCSVVRWLEILQHVGAAGGGDPLRTNYVLDRQGNACEGGYRGYAAKAPVTLLCLFHAEIIGYNSQGLYLPIHPSN